MGVRTTHLCPKNQIVKEEHLTFISTDGYIAHKTVSNKKGPTLATTVLEVLEENDSMNSVRILVSDGENANTGWKGNKLFLLHKIYENYLKYFF